jgi:hypothetical protein
MSQSNVVRQPKRRWRRSIFDSLSIVRFLFLAFIVTLMTTVIVFILLAVFGVGAVEAYSSTEKIYASEFANFNQGLKNNGNKVEPAHSNPKDALFVPERKGGSGYVSLGFGGNITLKLDSLPSDAYLIQLEIVGRRGEDEDCDENPVTVNVFVERDISKDPEDWIPLGSLCNSGKFLNVSDLPHFQYVFIEDISNPDELPQGADGYGLDGIILTYCKSSDCPHPTKTLIPTFLPSDTATPTLSVVKSTPTLVLVTPTLTPSLTPSPTIVLTQTLSSTPTTAFTQSHTPTKTLTPSRTPSTIPSATFTPSLTPSSTLTQTVSIIQTSTFTSSNTPTRPQTSGQTHLPASTATSLPSLLPLSTPTQALSMMPSLTATFTLSLTPLITSSSTVTPTQTSTVIDKLGDIQAWAAIAAILLFIGAVLGFIYATVNFSIALLIRPSNFDRFASYFDQHPVLRHLIIKRFITLIKGRLATDYRNAIQKENRLIDESETKHKQCWQKIRNAIENGDKPFHQDMVVFQELSVKIGYYGKNIKDLEARLDKILEKLDEWSRL